ncbi:lipopolysaccharide biosynthesis protein [Aquamicrobium segne]|uniref:Lipopolysaccharide biosynthesis protein n=2 Tax=Aquamicrobium segne TaxID=469547 RepID=A0ABW0GY18_9HYPH
MARLSTGVLGRRIAREGAWVVLGQALSAIAALVSIRIMTELLAPEEFGRLTLLVGVAALALGLTATPKLQALIRYYPDAARTGRIESLRKVGIQLIMPLLTLACVILAAFWLLAGTWIGSAWYMGLLVAALLYIDCLRSLELSLFNAARRQRAASVIYVADAWSRPLMAIICVLIFGSSAEAALAGYIAGSAAVVLAMHLWMRLEGASGPHAPLDADEDFNKKLALSIRRYALPLAPLAIFGWLSGVGDRYIIAGLLSLQDAGLYAAAYGLASRPFLMLSGVVELTMRPVLQNAVAAGDRKLVTRTKRIWLLLTGAGAAFGVICFILLSDWVGHLLLAEQYRLATGLMPWIAFGYALYNIATVYTRFCYAFDDTKAVLLLAASGGLLGVAVMVPAIFLWGLTGAALSVSAGFGIQLLFASTLARRAVAGFSSPKQVFKE